MNKIVCGGLLLIISFGISGCSFHRLVTRKRAETYDKNATGQATDTNYFTIFPHVILPQPDTVVENTPDTSLIKMKLVDELNPIWKNRLDYNTFSGKAKVHFESPDDKKEFTVNIRIKKDSAIWINVSDFGITGARILITPDSIFMIMPLKKEYRKIALKDAAKILPTKVDFASLQHFITGEPLRGGKIIDATNFGGSWSLQVEDSNYIQRITYNKADTTMRTSQLRTRNPNGPQTMSEYGSYIAEGVRKISTQRVVNIRNGNDVYMIDMNFSKFDFDEQLEFPFNIPQSYTEQK